MKSEEHVQPESRPVAAHPGPTALDCISRRKFLRTGAGAWLLTAAPVTAAGAEDPWKAVPGILSRIRPPRFPKRDFLLTNYGAVADGRSLCTDAFRRAIEACSQAGGGRVVVPAGEYLTGPVRLLSGVNLHVSTGARVRFSTDTRLYLPPVLTRWEGVECMNYSPLIYAFGQENIAVTGEGVLDGQADNEH